MEDYIWRLQEKISTFTIDCYREMILTHYKPVKLEFIPLLNIHLKELRHAPISPLFKSDGHGKSTKILISWQELKNQFLSFFVHR